MKVLMVTSEWPNPDRPDGVPFVVSQIDSLRRCGIDADVFAFRGDGDPRNYLRARSEVRARLRAQRYDVVHAHFGQAGLAAIGTIPSVVTFYGSDLEGIVGARGRYTARGAALRIISRYVARMADAVILVSRSLARRLPSRVSYEVIPLGVDLEVFRPSARDEARGRLGLDARRFLILFSGRPDVPVKRHGLAMRAVRELAPRLPADLVVVQGQPQDVVACYMNACDCLLVTSRHEGAPTMVKEALACNLPVVSVDVGDIKEWIEPLPGCVLARDDSPASIAAALESVLMRSDRFDAGAIAARFDERSIAQRILAVYARLAGDGEHHGTPEETP